ncbi:MAG TPA: host attachment protein [Patescibacteria group bacterium]|nr:host attachment protein [Patescibacteria group bacterium]
MKITGALADKGFHAFDAAPQSHQGQKTQHIWVLVTDHQHAHIYRKTAGGLELIADARADGNTGTESFDGHINQVSAGREKKDHDPRKRQNNRDDMEFAHSLANWLNLANDEHAFDRLVLVADQHTLGHLRSNLSRNVQDRVTAELGKDLTKLPVKEIRKHLDDSIVF